MVFWKNGKFHAIMWIWPFLCFKKKQKQRKNVPRGTYEKGRR